MSKLSQLRTQHPQWDVDLLDLLKAKDPSETGRYLPFLFKCLTEKMTPEKVLDKLLGEDLALLTQFHKFYEDGLIEKKDILTYKNFKDIKTELKLAEEKIQQREAEKQVVRIFENDAWVILKPLTYEATSVYGRGSRWCITDKATYGRYEKLFYFIMCISKTSKVKYCISKRADETGRVECWNEKDNKIDFLTMDLPCDCYNLLIKDLKENYSSVYDLRMNMLVPTVKGSNEKVYMWLTSEGERIEVKNMETGHINNVLKRVERWNTDPARSETIMEMRRELKRRNDREVEEVVTTQLDDDDVTEYEEIQTYVDDMLQIDTSNAAQTPSTAAHTLYQSLPFLNR